MAGTIDQVYLMVPSLGEPRAFYEDVLGFPVIEEGDRSVEFDTGACRLKLERDFDPQTLAAFGLEEPGSNRGEGVIVNVRVADVEAVYERVQRAGDAALTEPKDVAWGKRLFLVRDPTGYVLEINRPL
jgi:catechol 2,3-dioxygenase-like lactoylglutathione lyase family enzyme